MIKGYKGVEPKIDETAFIADSADVIGQVNIGKNAIQGLINGIKSKVNAVKDALHARELVKVSVLKNCLDDPHEIAQVLAERTGSEVVQVIGKKIVLYKKNFELEEKRKRALKREKQNHHGVKNMKKSDKVQKSFSKPDKRSAAKGKKSKTDQGTAKYLWGDK